MNKNIKNVQIVSLKLYSRKNTLLVIFGEC